MDEQTQTVTVSRRRSRSAAEQLVAEYETSGLSRTEFCRERGLSLATLARYRKRHPQGETTPGNRWIAVEVSSTAPAPSAGLVVVLPGGRRIEVGCGFDAGTLAQLLTVLERR